jgi:hypothetical protein
MCVCPAAGGTWGCGTCPATEPTGACDVAGIRCAYDTTQCSCFGGGGGGAQWLCFPTAPADGGTTTGCPGSPPTAGDACTSPTQTPLVCRYGNNQVCACDGQTQTWLCNF